MSNLISYSDILAMQKRKSVMDMEQEAEVRNMHVLQMNYKDVFMSAIGKENSTSLVRQAKAWKESLDNEKVNDLFLFVNIDTTVDRFLDYYRDKYKGAKKKEVEELLNDADVQSDIKRLITALIYEHKGELTIKGELAFINPQAHNKYMVHHIIKLNRGLYHEAVRAGIKVMGDNFNLSESELTRKLDGMLDAKIQQAIIKCLPSRPLLDS